MLKAFSPIWLLGSLAPWLLVCGTFAQSAQSVVYGGFAYVGRNDEIQINYPYCSRFDAGEGEDSGAFEVIARDIVKSAHQARENKLNILFGSVDKQTHPRVLAFAMTEERVLKERVGEFSKLVVQLGFEFIVLDFTEAKVVCSVPIFIELIDAKKTDFTDADITDRIGTMVRGERSQLGEVAAKALTQLRVRPNAALTLRVTDVQIGEKALSFLPKAFKESHSAYAQAIAQQFGSLLSSKAGVALLPFAKDAANSKMTLRFKNGDAAQFKIPDPTFAVILSVPGFKKVLDKQSDAEAIWIYGAWLGVQIIEPELGKVYFNTVAKYPVSKLVPASQKDVDDFPIVSEALKGAEVTAIETLLKDKTASANVIKKCQL